MTGTSGKMRQPLNVSFIMGLAVLISACSVIASSRESILAPQDSRAFTLLAKSLGLSQNARWLQECSTSEEACSRCPHRIKCRSNAGSNLLRITSLDLSGLNLQGELPSNLFGEPDAFSELALLDVSKNPGLLDSSSCVRYNICGTISCYPETYFCSSPKESTMAARSLATTIPTLADASELAAWQSFYDGAGGNNWRTCGGAAARANPCDPSICAGGGIFRYILCDTFNGKVSLAQINFQDNFMRGVFNDTAVRAMPNLQFLWVTNTAAANSTTANVLFMTGSCANLQRCYGGVMNCNFDNTAITLCPRVYSTSPTSSPSMPPPTPKPTTLAPTPQPTTLAPSSKSPTSTSPTLQPTSKSPTSLSPTSKAPTRSPTQSPTKKPTSMAPSLSPTFTKTKAPTMQTNSPTVMPTKYPSSSPTVRALPPSDLVAWQQVYTALHGTGWDFCDTSFDDPCNPNVNGCVDFTYIHCNVATDGTYRITQIFMQDNSMLGIVPDSAFLTLGPHLELLDLSSLGGGNRLGMQGSCLDFQFCYQNAKCYFSGSGPVLCPERTITLAPTMYAPINPSELFAWQKMFDALDGFNWRAPCGAGGDLRTNPCFYPNCVRCVFSGNSLHFSALALSNVGLKGYLDDGIFWALPFLTSIDFSNNKNAQGQGALYSDDCIRAETCFNPGSFCNFNNSGVSLCTTPLITHAPAFSGRLELAFADYIAFYMLYSNLNGPHWILPSSCTSPDQDPCFACPNRIRCIQNPLNPAELIMTQLLLDNMNVTGSIPLVPLDHLFSRGLNRLIMTNNHLTLTDGGCLTLIPCYNGNATCDFRNSGIDLCDPPIGMPPTNAPTLPTKSPTMTASNPCRTSGGLAMEGTPCAVPFLYSSIPFYSCISFTSRPPLSTVPYEEPKVPTDFWCPTVGVYNLDTQNSWGFCDCSNQGPTITPAPFTQFTFVPTVSPTRTPPTSAPTPLPPTTRAPTRIGQTYAPSKTPTTSVPTRSPSSSAPTFSPTTSRPSNNPTRRPTPPTTFQPTTFQPTQAPLLTKSPSSKAPTTLTPTAKTPTKSPSVKPSGVPTKSPTIHPSKSPSSSPTRKRTNAPSRAPSTSPTSSPPTKSPVFLVSDAELNVWNQIYDSLGGSGWLQCSNMKNNPCGCQGSASIFVTCATMKGRRRLQGGDGNTHITAISLPSNNVTGIVPKESLEALPNLAMLDLQGNAVTLPAGFTCSDFAICAKSCKIGTICDSSATTAPASSAGSTDNGGLIAGIVILVLILVALLLVFCMYWRCANALPAPIKSCLDRCGSTGKSSAGAVATGGCCAWCATRKFSDGDGTKKKDMNEALMVAEPDDDEDEYGDPAFSRLAKQVTEKMLPSKDEQRPDGRSHFSLMKGESLPTLKDNSSLSEAKLQAMELDDAARKDVPDMDHLLENVGLGHKTAAFKRAGVTDIIALMRLNDDRMRQIGLNLGERVRLKRTIDVRKGLQNDPVFGKGT